MSSQPKQAADTMHRHQDDQITPVIIKSDGGGGDTEHPELDRTKVMINDLNKLFESHIENNHWHSAMSAMTAHIVSLKVKDGTLELGPFSPPSADELVTLRAIYGADILQISEVPAPAAPKNKRLAITSPVSFTVVEPGAGGDEWVKSDAEFPADAPFLLFTQGGRVIFRHQCEFKNVELTLSINWDDTPA